ncbi:MAG: hypothetical protein OIF58_11705, partial [Cohaesibacter sp.]|nr:hypothetical protein [Cohaesibacter sp.]
MLKAQIGPLVGGADYLGFDLLNGRMVVLDGAKAISDAALIDAVDKTGLSATKWDKETADQERSVQLSRLKLFTLGSALAWLGGLLFHLFEKDGGGLLSLFAGHEGNAMPLIEMAFYVSAAVLGARYVAPKAFFSIRRLSPDMNLLMMVAVVGAMVIGEFFEAATVALLFALSLTLEAWS